MATAQQARRLAPESFPEVAEALRAAGADRRALRPRGGGTKLGWGRPAAADLELSTAGLARVVSHDVGDLTAVLEAGVPLADAQATFAGAGQRLALDPPEGGGSPTVGGVLAAGDSGPLRHRYGAPRDLVLGVTVALSDGTVARAGGRVIKNVAGYDLAKLFTGSFGTLGVILEVAVRLHPSPPATATVRCLGDDPDMMGRVAGALAAAPLELEALDLAWARGRGAVLARVAGGEARTRAQDAAGVAGAAGGDAEVLDEGEDDELWATQREHQRALGGVGIRVSALPTALPSVMRAAERAGGAMVARAGLGLAWIALPYAEPDELIATVTELRRGLRPAACVVLDAPEAVRAGLDPWDVPVQAPHAQLMRRVKDRFDPAWVCSPGIFVAGI
jgi:glycolate oxidase FAD binding subunit